MITHAEIEFGYTYFSVMPLAIEHCQSGGSQAASELISTLEWGRREMAPSYAGSDLGIDSLRAFKRGIENKVRLRQVFRSMGTDSMRVYLTTLTTDAVVAMKLLPTD
uniref:Transposase n=1 Tax=Panagrellus redivivus TaxID=6233 RepID=A0A7E4ZSW5_PANRE